MSRRAYCTARTASSGRQCRSFGCWCIAGPSDLYCKRHAQEIAAFNEDTRIIHVTTGRIEVVEGRKIRCRPRVGPPPESLDEITGELRTVRCRRDWLRCRRAIFTQLDDLVDKRKDTTGLVYTAGLKPGLAHALYAARRRLERIGEPA